MIYPASTQRDVFEYKDSHETCKPVLLDSSEPCFFLNVKRCLLLCQSSEAKSLCSDLKSVFNNSSFAPCLSIVSVMNTLLCSFYFSQFLDDLHASLIYFVYCQLKGWGSHALPACNARAIVEFFFCFKASQSCP